MKIILFVLLMILSVGLMAEPPVSINGRMLLPQEVAVLEYRLGGRVVPGRYRVDANGCWVNVSNRTQGCIGQGGQGTTNYLSRNGSGERSSDGSWNHYSRDAGGSVGATANGCIYTSFGWSNC